MDKKTERILATVAGPIVVASVAWIGGYNFDSRGFWPAWAFLMTALYVAWQWFAPWWRE